MRIAVRVDASTTIGSGHLMRCLTLVDALSSTDDQVCFISRHMPSALASLIENKGYSLCKLPSDKSSPVEEDAPRHGEWLGVSLRQDSEETLEVLNEFGGVDWLIIDHYALDARWENAVRPGCKYILAIDDLADRTHVVDALLDQNYYRDVEIRYQNILSPDIKRFLGPKYALLRPDFFNLRQNIKPRTGEVKQILVFFGSMDPDNYTGFAINALASLHSRFIVDVVIGAAHPFKDAIVKQCQELGYICHIQTNKMAELMAKADLSIGAGGTAVWERCALGLPAIVLCIAFNQRELIEEMRELNLFSSPSIELNDIKSFSQSIKSLLENSSLRNSYSLKSLNLVDGCGAKHVAEWMRNRLNNRKA